MMREEFWWGQMRRGPTGFPSRTERGRELRRRAARSNSETARLRQTGRLACTRKESKIYDLGLRPPSRDLALLNRFVVTAHVQRDTRKSESRLGRHVPAFSMGSPLRKGKVGRLDRQGTAAKEPCAQADHGLASPCGHPPRAEKPAAARRRAQARPQFPLSRR